MSTAAEDDFGTMPAEIDTSNFVDQKGTYIFFINEATIEFIDTEKSTDKKCLIVQNEVMSGTTPGMEGKFFKARFWWPTDEDSDGGDFLRRLLANLLIATGIQPGIINVKGKIDPHPTTVGKNPPSGWLGKLKGRCWVAALVPSKNPKFLEIDGMKFTRPDDPALIAAKVPVDEQVMQAVRANYPPLEKFIPPQEPVPPAKPPIQPSPNMLGPQQPVQPPPVQQPTIAAPAASPGDIGDL